MSDSAQLNHTTDERIKKFSKLRKALIRPELGGIVGTVAVFTFFLLFAYDSGMFNSRGVMNWSIVSAQFVIIAVGAGLLMIAGEFDLSVGSMIGFAGMMIAIFSVTLGWPVWVAILVTFVMCLGVGASKRFHCYTYWTAELHRDASFSFHPARSNHLSTAGNRA